jgi:Tol biopolymer transport system component
MDEIGRLARIIHPGKYTAPGIGRVASHVKRRHAGANSMYNVASARRAIGARRRNEIFPGILLLAVLLGGCGGDSGGTGPNPPPTTGAMTVTTSTAGADPDWDGYSVSIDGGTAQPIGTDSSLTLSSLAARSHNVEVGGIAKHCAVDGAQSRTVNVTAGDTATVAFDITCDDGTLLFYSNRQGSDGDTNYELYTIGADGSGLHQLTVTSGFDTVVPRWSPDGSKIVFMSNRDGNNEIYLMNADGSGLRRLTNDPASDEYPAWSPDGEQIAFNSDRGDIVGIYTMDASDGGNVTLLTPDSAADYYPAWSPDGKRIAFMSDPPPYANNFNIASIDSDGSGREQITNEVTSASFPSWSPSGTRLAIAINVPTDSYNIFTIASDGSDREQLTDKSGLNYAATWSPGGRRLAYCVLGDIYTMNDDGTKQTYITRSFESLPYTICTVDWGP